MTPVNKKTHSTFIKEVFDLVGNEYAVLEKYSGKDKKISFKHNTCNSIFVMSPHNFLSGSRCPICAKKIRKEKHRVSFDEFYSRILKENPRVLDNIEILDMDNFLGIKSKINIRLISTGQTISVTARNLLVYDYSGETMCLNTDSFNKKLQEKSNTIINLSEYKNAKTELLLKCTVCNNTFLRNANNILNNTTCPYCKKNELISKRIQLFSKRISNRQDISEYELDYSTYIDMRKKMDILHKKCNKVFSMSPHDFLYSQYSCPNCRKSKSEAIIENFLIESRIEYIPQKKFKDCRNKLPLPFDFYIPSKNILIEFDGEYHYKKIGNSDLEYTKNNDNIKTEYCANNGFTLIRIPYYLKKDIIKILEYIKNDNITECLKFIKSSKFNDYPIGGEIPQQE